MQELFSEAKRERWQAFWNRTHAASPLVGFHVQDLRTASVSSYRIPRGSDAGEWFLKSIQNGSLAEAIRRQVGLNRVVSQDAVQAADPCSRFPWAEAIAGCRPVLDGEEWNILPPEHGWMERDESSTPDSGTSWEQALEILHAGLRVRPDDGWGTACMQAAGPTDITVRTVPSRDLSRVLSRSQDTIRSFAGRQADTIERLIRRQAELAAPGTDEGVAGPYGIWSGRRTASIRERESACVSRKDYEACFLPALAGIAAAFGACIVELDTASLHVLDLLLELPEVCAVVVRRRADGPSLPDMLPAFRRIQDFGRGLVIAGPLDTEDIDHVLDRLGREGLFLSLQVESIGETGLWMNYILRRCGIRKDDELRSEAAQ